MLKHITIKVDADTALKLMSSESAGGFYDRAFAMYPLRLYRVKPGAFARQPAGNYLHPNFALSPQGQCSPVVLPYPFPHHSAHMPGSIVPYHHQHALTFGSQSLAQPLQIGNCNGAHCSPIYEAQHHFAGVLPQQSIATQRLGVRVIFADFTFNQAQRLFGSGPTMHGGVCQAAPPYFILEPHHPTCPKRRFLCGSLNQPLASLFFRAYSGSGEVIQFLALRQPTPKRLRACRTVSSLTSRCVKPVCAHTSAASSNVHREVCLPKSRGLRCNMARNASLFSSVNTLCVWSGLGPGRGRRKHSVFCSWKAWIALRTVCTAQPRLRAIWEGRSPA